jgi:triosephosphate isomerase
MTAERPRPLVAGNWKMNGLRASAKVVDEIGAGYSRELRTKVDLALCVPATLVGMVAHASLGTRLAVGGQDCHAKESGAYTGNIAAEMLADAGATYVIVGHSERRQYEGETNEDVKEKAMAARRAGLIAILCIGETREERESGRALDVVRSQLAGSVPEGATASDLIIAYEPVWAIGTGLTPTAADVAEVHAAIRADLKKIVGDMEAPKVRILYGGSVKPSNSVELMSVANVDGALVGGASLVAADFLGIAAAYTA